MTILSAEAVNWTHQRDGASAASMSSRRLMMRMLEPAEIPMVVDILSNLGRMAKFWPEPKSKADIAQWLNDRSCWTFRRIDNGSLIVVGTTEQDGSGGYVVHGFSAERGNHELSLEAIRLGEAVCFERFGVHRLTASTTTDNLGAVRLLEAAEWKLEGRLRQAARIGADFRDVLVYAKLKGE